MLFAFMNLPCWLFVCYLRSLSGEFHFSSIGSRYLFLTIIFMLKYGNGYFNVIPTCIVGSFNKQIRSFLWLLKQAVQQVISNLLIAQIELCAEDSPEIQPYSHERQVEKIVVPLGEELVEIQNAYIGVSFCIYLFVVKWTVSLNI